MTGKGDAMTESIVGVRLTRNLRYKLTYVKVFETYLESATSTEVQELLLTLIQSQQAAISALASYLRRLDLSTQDLELNDKLLSQAAGRTEQKAQLRFVYEGLERAADWYLTQLSDKQMTGDPELRRLLIELGEMEAARLWRAGAVMAMLRIPTKAKEKDYEAAEPVPDPTQQEDWKPRLMEDVGRPSWAGGSEKPNRWGSAGKPRRKER
jgi:hypothetical protein